MSTSISVNKKVLNPYIKMISDRCSFLYGINYTDLLVTNMNLINDVEISNGLDEYTPMAFNIVKRIIKINKNYCKFDVFGKPVNLFKNDSKLQMHSLIHELLHAASIKKSGCGIPYPFAQDNIGLNEGITQMMADDICGYVENKFLKNYNDLKIVAKIIRNTFGNDIICESYFKESDILVNQMNKLSGDKYYYDTIIARLNSLNSLCIVLFNNSGKYLADYDLYDRRLENIFKDLIINLVIPKLNTLSIQDKKEYITKLLLDISADDKIKNEIKTILAKFINMSNYELSIEKDKLIKELKDFNKEDNFISLMKKDDSFNSEIFVSRDGKVTLLGNPNQEITSELECKLIYEKIFRRRYPNFSHNDALKYASEIRRGKPLNIRYNNVLDRRIIYCGIQKKLLEIGFNLVNDYTEFDNKMTIKPVMIHTNKSIIFKDLNLLAQKYSLYYKVDGDYDYNYSICDRETRKKNENINISELSMFACTWLHSVSGELDYDKNAFSLENEKNYNIIIGAMKEAYRKTNNFDINFMEMYCYTNESKKILRKLLSTPFKVETAYRFIQLIEGSTDVMQEYKGESYNQKNIKNYDLDVARKDAYDILHR